MDIPLCLQLSCDFSGQMVNHFEGAFKAHKEVHGNTLAYKVGTYAVRWFIALPLLLAGAATLLALSHIGFVWCVSVSIGARSMAPIKDFVSEMVALVAFPVLAVGCVAFGCLPPANRCQKFEYGNIFFRDDLENGTGECAFRIAQGRIDGPHADMNSAESFFKVRSHSRFYYTYSNEWGYYAAYRRLMPIALRLTPQQYGERLFEALESNLSLAACLWALDPTVLSGTDKEGWRNVKEDLVTLFSNFDQNQTMTSGHLVSLQETPVLFKLFSKQLPQIAQAYQQQFPDPNERTFLQWLQQVPELDHQRSAISLLLKVYVTLRLIEQRLPVDPKMKEDLTCEIDKLNLMPKVLARLTADYLPQASIRIHSSVDSPVDMSRGHRDFPSYLIEACEQFIFSSGVEQRVGDKLCARHQTGSRAFSKALQMGAYTLCEKFIIIPVGLSVGAVLAIAIGVGVVVLGILLNTLFFSIGRDLTLNGCTAIGCGLFAIAWIPLHMMLTTLHLQHAVRSAASVYARCMYLG